LRYFQKIFVILLFYIISCRISVVDIELIYVAKSTWIEIIIAQEIVHGVIVIIASKSASIDIRTCNSADVHIIINCINNPTDIIHIICIERCSIVNISVALQWSGIFCRIYFLYW